MPHSTHAYVFELKVGEFAAQLSRPLTGEARTFLIVFGEDGAARSVIFESPTPSWHDFVDELRAAGRPYLFYDPFDLPEYAYLTWHKLEQTVMEQLIGQDFQESDFVRYKELSRAPALSPANSYPASWAVMF
jgi:hypothetical protein